MLDIALVTLVVALVAGNSDAAIVQTTDAFATAINANNETALKALFVPDAVLCDEIPPYRWTGSGAVVQWLRDDATLTTRHGILDSTITISPPTFVHTDDSGAYVVRPMVDTYTIGGKPQRETGLLTFALINERPTWRIRLMCFTKTGDTSDSSWNGP
jgi:hypothetical protein